MSGGHVLNYLLTDETKRAHRARWFVYTGAEDPETGRRERIPHTSSMRGFWPGYDVVCSCGYETKTGGGLRHYVEDLLFDHRYSAQSQSQNPVPDR
jgi:hypothetical protein